MFNIESLRQHIKVHKILNEGFKFNMNDVERDGDLLHYQGHLDTLAYQHGLLSRKMDDNRVGSEVYRKSKKKAAKIEEQFSIVAGMANMAGHSPHDQGHTAFRHRGSLHPRFYRDVSHIGEEDRMRAFSERQVSRIENPASRRSNSENIVRFGDTPGPWHVGYAL